MWTCPQCRLAVPDGRFCPADGSALRLEIDDLVVGRELGRGMTGTVYRAAAPGGAPVAVKILHGEWLDDPEMRARFEREIRAAAAVRHPSLVTARDHGVLGDGRPYLIMELVDGPQLDEVLALGPLAEARAVELGRDLAGALGALHQAGVVHRDVKPGNIKIGKDGRARLLDLGVARRIDGDEARLTGGGLTVGTPHYMAPEQCTGEPVDGRTDVYALGVTMYRMVTGALPFDGAAVAVMLAHTSRAPEPPSARAEVSPPLEALILACLAKRPDDRPDARGLAAALEALAWGEAPDPWAATVPFERGAGRAATVRAADDEADDEAATSTSASAFVGEAATAATPIRARAHRRARRRPWLAAAAVVVAAAAALLALTPLHHALGLDGFGVPHHHAAAPATATVPPSAPDAPALPGEPTEQLIVSDAWVAMRIAVPITLEPGTSHDLRIEVWDADGRPLDTTDLVVTFAGPGGAVVGLAASPARDRGVYQLRARFDVAGTWTMRVFPPLGDSMLQIPLDVGTRPQS